MFRPTWPSSCVCMMTDNKERQESKHAHKNQETNENTTKNTNEKLHSITTCNKGNKSSEADSFRNIKVKHHTHLKMAM
jgi:hypothetical protein